MRNCIIIFSLGFVMMAIGIAYAIMKGNFFDELELMRPLPWFHLSMLDLYMGFLVFSVWILYREKALTHAVLWILLLLSLGNLITCLYALIALVRARGNWQEFWMGRRSARDNFHTSSANS